MPIRFGVGLSGEPKVEEQITAPLPVISFGFNAALSRNWLLRQSVDFLYLSLSGYTGSILDLNIKVERNLSKRIGLGLGFELLDIELTSQEEGRIPGQDFVGQVGFGYTGLQLYIRGRFP